MNQVHTLMYTRSLGCGADCPGLSRFQHDFSGLWWQHHFELPFQPVCACDLSRKMGGSNDNTKYDDAYEEPVQKCTSPLRWIILVLACVMLIGSYYCYDIPAAIKTQLDDYMGNPSDYELKFGLLYTLYAAPNVS